MTYVEGFVTAVPRANRDAYITHANSACDMVKEFGATRFVENWADDVPVGKVTDFRKAVQAKDDEDILFSWFEYPDKATRDAANARMMSDPRMAEMGKDMPFDGMRMIFGGFDALIDVRSEGATGYTDGIIAPVPVANKDAYRALAEKNAAIFKQFGAVRVVEAWGDDIPEGKVTDYQRAVKAEDSETVVYAWIEWPDKATRNAAWEKMMAEPLLRPDGPPPFDGKRMFWGGFEPVIDN